MISSKLLFANHVQAREAKVVAAVVFIDPATKKEVARADTGSEFEKLLWRFRNCRRTVTLKIVYEGDQI